MIGMVFGRLTVTKRAGKTIKRELLWECRCECGGMKVTTGYLLRSDQTRSCGCLQRETITLKNSTHLMSGTRIYRIWSNMLSRCGNSNNPQFADYGARGIFVCQEWHDFEAFSSWACANGYRDSLSIDRINNDDGYKPDNCRWATSLQQSRNKRPRRDQKLSDAQVSAIRSDSRAQHEIAAQYGVNQQHISRIKCGKRRAFPTERNYNV